MLIALFSISISVRLLPVRHEHENSDEHGIHFHPTGAKDNHHDVPKFKKITKIQKNHMYSCMSGPEIASVRQHVSTAKGRYKV